LESVDEAELERRIKTRMDKLAKQWDRSGPSYSDKLSEAKEEMGQVAPRESSE
jgi:hypothetical protein